MTGLPMSHGRRCPRRCPSHFHMGIACALIAAGVSSIASPALAQQTTYYVSTSGSDSNAGTEAQPFRTLTKARDVVRTINKTMTQDIVVCLRGGAYAIAQPLILDDRDSGANGHNIVYRSCPGERAEICGGRKIGGWEKDPNGVWEAKTDIPCFRQLYVNGVRAVRARGAGMPDIDPDGRKGYTTSNGAMASWKNQNDIELVFGRQWDLSICKVDHIEKNGSKAVVRMLEPYHTLARLKGGVSFNVPADVSRAYAKFYVENAREVLDEPGEWYLDRIAHVVYYIPRAGEDMNTAEVMAPVVEKLLELRGTLDAPVHNIRFEGITFCHASWLRPSQVGLVNLQANFVLNPFHVAVWGGGGCLIPPQYECDKGPSNIVLHAAKSARFERCTFTKFGGGGVDLEYGSQDNVISGCEFYDISSSAIQVGDTMDHHPADPRQIVKNNRIVNNHIHDVAVQYICGVGIFAGYTDGTVIAHNEIHNLPYSGVSVGWGWGRTDLGSGPLNYDKSLYFKEPTPARNLRCEYNHIYKVMMDRNDGGAIYTLGDMPGSVIRGNHVHDNANNPGGIYLDEGSGHIEVTGNVVYKVFNPMNFNNAAQNRRSTCREHGNHFKVLPTDPAFPEAAKAVIDKAGLEPAYRDLLTSRPQ